MTDAERKLEDIRLLIRLIVNERISDLSLREDAEQEAMLAAWERLRDGKSHGIAIHAAKQATVDVGRGRRMTGSKAAGVVITRTVPLVRQREDGANGNGVEEYVVEPADDGAEAAYDALVESESLEALLEPLSAVQRSVVLPWLDGLTTREIAPLVDMTHQGVSYHLKRAFGILGRTLRAS